MTLENRILAQDEADWTTREIDHQPDVWEETFAIVAAQRDQLDTWLRPLLSDPRLRIIMTGAGSSAYIGDALAPALTKALGRKVEAISTTSIVAIPDDFLLADQPTLLISFGRSGNSPESIGAARLATDLVAQCHHLIVCCDPTSVLGRFEGSGEGSVYRLFMPARALDRSFAMTSSFTSMLLGVLAVFAWDAEQARTLVATARALLAGPIDDIERIVDTGFSRGVFLGSGALQGIATEAALKSLEMAAGDRSAWAESPLGFRHGPKFVVDDATIVVLLTHPATYTRQYDIDLWGELQRDGTARTLVALHDHPALSGTTLNEAWIGPAYLIWCQRLAYHAARALGHAPDNPSPSGNVNRVVQGVTLHPFPQA